MGKFFIRLIGFLAKKLMRIGPLGVVGCFLFTVIFGLSMFVLTLWIIFQVVFG